MIEDFLFEMNKGEGWKSDAKYKWGGGPSEPIRNKKINMLGYSSTFLTCSGKNRDGQPAGEEEEWNLLLGKSARERDGEIT